MSTVVPRKSRTMKISKNEVPLVKQSQQDECDINKIMRKFRNGGELQHINLAQGQYGDFSSAQDFTDAYTAVAKAEAAFARLPAYARDMMGNDPEVFLHKMEDPEYMANFARLGLYDEEAGAIVRDPKSPEVLAPEPEARVPESAGTAPATEAKTPRKAGSIMGGE